MSSLGLKSLLWFLSKLSCRAGSKLCCLDIEIQAQKLFLLQMVSMGGKTKNLGKPWRFNDSTYSKSAFQDFASPRSHPKPVTDQCRQLQEPDLGGTSPFPLLSTNFTTKWQKFEYRHFVPNHTTQ